MTPKIVFLDIDGTLCDRSGIVSDSTLYALRTAAANGNQMVVCSGRTKVQIFPKLNPADYQGVISAAGSCVTCGGRVVWQKIMEPDAVRRMVRFFRGQDMPFFLQSEEAIYTDPHSASQIRDAFLEIGRSEKDVEEVFGTLTVVDDPEEQPNIEKALYYRCKLPVEEVDAALGHAFTIQDSSYKVTRFCDGEVTCRGINKAEGMQHYLNYVGRSAEDTIAFGDGPNDFEMLQFAGLGVAMGNGVPALRERADYVTDTVTNNGIEKAFRKLGLI
ncbi:MAG: HAD family hydrolase [Oscillospiraceae bacterium]|nr:HAD family hydrolase [Oscillospiraceae bacterium]